MKIGLIGVGAIGRVHAYALRSLPFFVQNASEDDEIVAVCAAHRESAEAAAKRYALGAPTSNEDDLIYDPAIDIIDICTPNVCHYATAKKALLAGKHVYCEKPLAMTVAETEELAALASERGLTAQVVFNNRFLPPVLRAKELLDEGRLGAILSFRASYRHSSLLDSSAPAWRQKRSQSGGGALTDLGSHLIDLVRYLCGDFVTVSGREQRYHPTSEVEEAFYVNASLTCGAVGTLEASKIAVGSNDDLTLCIDGEKGALRFDLMQPNYLYFYDATRRGGAYGGERGFTAIECVGRYPAPGGVFPSVKAPISWLMGHVMSMNAFLCAVREGKRPSPSFEDGAAVQRVLAVAYRSAENDCQQTKV